MARSLNKVTLIGNLTRDPEMRYTPQGSAVCSFGVATNRQWKDQSGQAVEDVEFHRVTAWNQLAEICAKLLHKGDQVYVEGRLNTNEWTGQDDVKRKTTEIVINEMILLQSRSGAAPSDDNFDVPEDFDEAPDFEEEDEEEKPKKSKSGPKKSSKKKSSKKSKKEEEEDDDIPF